MHINILSCLVVTIMISGCIRSEELPADARDLVLHQAAEFYTNPFSGVESYERLDEIEVGRAWQADSQSAEMNNTSYQVWCVELRVSGVRAGEQASEQPVWVAIEDGEQGAWSAAALVTFSADWPYEACGQGKSFNKIHKVNFP